MKKQTYIAPEIEVTLFETEEMVLGSNLNDDPENITPTEEEYSGEFQSRSYLWDDNE